MSELSLSPVSSTTQLTLLELYPKDEQLFSLLVKLKPIQQNFILKKKKKATVIGKVIGKIFKTNDKENFNNAVLPESQNFTEEEIQIVNLVKNLYFEMQQELEKLQDISDYGESDLPKKKSLQKRISLSPDQIQHHKISKTQTIKDVLNLIHRLEKIFNKFQNHLDLVDPLLVIYTATIEKYWNVTRKAHCSHWKFLPIIYIQPNSVTRQKICLQKHKVDERFDFRCVQINNKEVVAGTSEHPLHDFTLLKEIQTEKSKYQAVLTASYPYVQPTSTDPAMVLKEKVLVSDPNNDGYFVVVNKGIAVGATVDGSGSGFAPRLASNIILATVNQMIDELLNLLTPSTVTERSTQLDSNDDVRENNCKKTSVDSTLNSLSSHVIFQWLQKLIVKSHQNCKNVQEAGSTTASFFVILKLENKQHDFEYVCCFAVTGDVEVQLFQHKTKEWVSLLKEPTSTEKARIDTSSTPGGLGGHHGDQKRLYGMHFWSEEDWGRPTSQKATSPTIADIKQQPRRVSKSGLRCKGNNLHFGQVLLTREDIVLFSTDGLGDCIDPPQLFRTPNSAQAFANSIGIPFMEQVELKTTLDSILAMPDYTEPELDKRPAFKKEPDEVNLDPKENWLEFTRKIPEAAIKIKNLKQIILNIVLNENITYFNNNLYQPYDLFEESSDQSNSTENIKSDRTYNRTSQDFTNCNINYNSASRRRKERENNNSPVAIIEKLTEFAKFVTSGERELYESHHSYLKETTWGKKNILDTAKENFCVNNPSPSNVCEKTIEENKSKYMKLKYLKPFLVPFAKMDHIAIQVISPTIID